MATCLWICVECPGCCMKATPTKPEGCKLPSIACFEKWKWRAVTLNTDNQAEMRKVVHP